MPFGPVCQHAVVALADQRQKLRARFFLVAEHAKHCRCNSGGMLFFHSAHHHAEMAGFNYHAHSLWLNDFLDGLGKLRGQPFLLPDVTMAQ